MNFVTFERNLKGFIDNLDKLVLDSAMELKDSIADLNVKQLEEGKRVDGGNIIPEYQSEAYAKAKKSIGAKPPLYTPDLKLTGAYHSGIYAFRGSGFIGTWSTDEKVDKLNAKYPKHLGLTVDSIEVMKPDVLDKLLIKGKNELSRS